MNDATIDALLVDLRTPGTEIKQKAVQALGQLPYLPEHALEALMDAVERGVVRIEAAQVLAQHPDLPLQIQERLALSSFSGQPVSGAVIAALANQTTLGAMSQEALVEVLDNADWSVRRAAAEALLHLGRRQESAQVALVQALTDPRIDVRQAAAYVLYCAGQHTKTAQRVLTTMIAPQAHVYEEDEDDEDREVARLDAARALYQAGVYPQRALGVLVNALGDPRWGVRFTAALNLGQIQLLPRFAQQALVTAFHDTDWFVHAEAIWAIGEQAKLPGTILKALLDTLRSEEEATQLAVTNALSRYCSQAGAPVPSRLWHPLLSALHTTALSPDPEVQAAAQAALVQAKALRERSV